MCRAVINVVVLRAQTSGISFFRLIYLCMLLTAEFSFSSDVDIKPSVIDEVIKKG